METSKKSSIPIVQSLQRALRILKCFTIENNSLTLTDISKQLGLHKSTTQRLLNTFIEENFIRKVDNDYMLDWIFLEMSAIVSASGGCQKVIHETLEEIVKQTNETCHFGILYNDKVLYIDKIESHYSLRLQSHIGKLAYLHSTGLGKALLASLDENKLLPVLYNLELPGFARNTITNHEQLLQEIKQTRQRGYAIDNEENEDGLFCLAIPLIGTDNKNYGAISISGPVSRIEGNISEYVKILQTETAKAAKSLGSQISYLSDLNNLS